MLLSHAARQFDGWPRKFRPSPKLQREFTGGESMPPLPTESAATWRASRVYEHAGSEAVCEVNVPTFPGKIFLTSTAEI
jgi:hypothetical protein